jgi:hypothetical protein
MSRIVHSRFMVRRDGFTVDHGGSRFVALDSWLSTAVRTAAIVGKGEKGV